MNLISNQGKHVLMSKSFYQSVLFIVLYMIYVSHGYTQTFQDFKAFEASVKQFAEQQIPHASDDALHIDIMQLNSKMQLPSCTDEIEMSLSRQGLSSTSNVVTLLCKGQQPWTLYVPLQIQLFTNVLAASRMIKPGEIIEKQDVIEKKYDKYLLFDGYFTRLEEVVGQAASRAIPAGGILGRKNIRKTALIKKKQPVELILKHGSIVISMRGIAKTNGFLNDQIKIINPVSRKEVEAVVTGNGIAEMIY